MTEAAYPGTQNSQWARAVAGGSWQSHLKAVQHWQDGSEDRWQCAGAACSNAQQQQAGSGSTSSSWQRRPMVMLRVSGLWAPAASRDKQRSPEAVCYRGGQAWMAGACWQKLLLVVPSSRRLARAAGRQRWQLAGAAYRRGLGGLAVAGGCKQRLLKAVHSSGGRPGRQVAAQRGGLYWCPAGAGCSEQAVLVAAGQGQRQSPGACSWQLLEVAPGS